MIAEALTEPRVLHLALAETAVEVIVARATGCRSDHERRRAEVDAIIAARRGPQVTLSKSALGRPQLDDGKWVSISHSDEWIAVALADRPVGVDIEADPTLDGALLARHLDPTDARQVLDATTPEQPERFRILWTRLEAVLKATGRGFDGAPIPAVASSPVHHGSGDYALLTIGTDEARTYTLSVAVEV